MKPFHAVALLTLIASPALAQNMSAPQGTSPSAQHSGAGIAGQPGGEAGVAVEPKGQIDAAKQTNPTTRMQDSSKIAGKPGSKSGPAVEPPSASDHGSKQKQP